MQETANHKARRRGKGAVAQQISVSDVASYVLEIIRGMRKVTCGAGQKDVRFLDYLLGMTESEAEKIANRQYH